MIYGNDIRSLMTEPDSLIPKPKPKEKPIVLRLPERYVMALDSIVKGSKGKIKSRNELIVDIIGIFLTEIEKRAKEDKNG